MAASRLAGSVEIARPVAVAVVIPAYRVAARIADVVSRVPALVRRIYVVDDACPETSGERLRGASADSRLRVIRHETNQGVGGATITGFRTALDDGADIVVKIDGDGQMDPAFLPELIAPILAGEADYAKGNRFWDIEGLAAMPWVRLWGNSFLSLLTHMLFRLYTVRAVVTDVAMPACYGNERSTLRAGTVIPEFLYKHARNLLKRIFYAYFLRDFSIASVELVLGALLLLWGLPFGLIAWVRGAAQGTPATAGTVMLAALPVILSVQFLLGFLQFDYRNVPSRPLSAR